MISAWIRSLFGKTVSKPARKPQRSARARFRPGVEAFEDRLVPATLYVDVTPGGNANPNGGIFSPVGGTNVTGLTLDTGGNPNPNLFTTVGAAVAASTDGDDIWIANDPTAYTEPGNAPVITAKSLDFLGKGSANPVLTNIAARFIQINGSAGTTVETFDRVTFTGGNTAGGLTLSALSSVTITNSTFDGNRSINGGAIGFGGGDLIVRASTFTNNSAASSGGAIGAGGGTLTLDGVTIGTTGNGNSSPRGGGIFLGGDATISFENNATNVQFNSATDSGGGIDILVGANTAITFGALLTVANNQTTAAGSFGGGIAMRGAASASLTINGAVTGNQANGDATSTGGGVAVTAGTVTIGATAVIGGAAGNTAAGDGGGINVTGGTLNLTAGARVANNTSTNGNGGGINFAGGTNHNMTGVPGNRVIISGNRALNTPAPVANKGHGGGINIAAGDVTMQGVDIGGINLGAANQAVFGGGLSVVGGSLAFGGTSVSIRFNSATTTGGGIDLGSTFAGTIHVSALSVADNAVTGANGHGGGVAVHGGTFDSIGATNVVQIFRNHADAAGATGGGLYQDGGIVTLTNAVVVGSSSIVNGNTANAGAGIHVAGGTMTLQTGGAVTFNTSATSGGGLLVSAGTANISGTVASNVANSAMGAGGGVAVTGGNVTFNGATIGGVDPADGNSASTGGGLSATGGSVSFSTAASTIRNNTSVQFGGGVDVAGGYSGNLTASVGVQILDNSVSGMNSHGGGLSVRATGANVQLTGATIARNTANAIGSGGGGVFQDNGTTALTATTIGTPSGAGGGNTAFINGGGAEIVGGSFSLLGTAAGRSLVRSNTATTGNGGGLFVGNAASVTITGTAANRVYFDNNAATAVGGGAASGSGGAIEIDAAYTALMQITNAVIGGSDGAFTAVGNRALRGGGIAKFNAATLDISDSLFTLNSASGLNPATDGGGGILLTAGTLTSDPTIYNNMMSATNGGAINVMGGTLSIGAGDQFTNNTATLNGGAINYGGGTGHTINSPGPGNFVVIASNTAGGNGGGINVALAAASTLVIDTTIIGGVPTAADPMNPGNGESSNAATTGNIAIDGDGGGINVASGTVSVANSTIGGTVADVGPNISGNRATDGGGINVALGTVTITSTTIGSTVVGATGNRATVGNGGGINVVGGAVSVTGGLIGSTVSLMQGNAAGLHGGGIAWSGGTLTLPGATPIRFNSATGNGGGIDITAGAALSITAGTSVLNNTANGSGGGIAHRGDGALTLNAAVNSNMAGISGGGVFVSGGAGNLGSLVVTGGTIGALGAGNTATVNGGGIAITGGNNSSITNGTVNANTAGASGGGINLAPTFASTLTLDTVTIGDLGAGNTATAGNGGGINVLGGSVTISSTTAALIDNKIIDNTATAGNGGGMNIATPAGTVTITGVVGATGFVNNVFNSNDAGGNGGGINLASGSLIMTGSSNFPTLPAASVQTYLTNNTAGGSGGGLNQSGGSLAITIAIVAGNAANGGDGGGLNFAGGTAGTAIAPLQRVSVFGNVAQGSGGGIANSMTPLFINNFTISGNSVNAMGGGDGGGVAITGALAVTSIVNTTIANNTGNGAGGLRLTAGSLTIGNTLIGANTGTDIRLIANPGETTPNLFQTFAGFTPVGTDITGQAPLLAPLNDYGGPTLTIALLPGSPAIDAGTGATGNDQRGVPIVNAVKDIGAFESRGFTFGAPVGTPQSTVINTNFATPLSIAVTANDPGVNPDGGIVTFTSTTNATGATNTGPAVVNVTIAGGVANRGVVTANGFFGDYNIGVSAKGMTTNATAFALTNLGVNSIVYTAQPMNTPSGQVINGAGGVIVQLRDQFNANLNLAGATVSITVSFGPGSLVPAAVVSALTDANGRAIFSSTVVPPNAIAKPLVINTTGTYRLTATTNRNSLLGAATATVQSDPFNITASKLLIDAVTTPVRSGQQFNVTARAVGVDNSVDPNFTDPVTLGINSFAATDASGVTPAAVSTAVNPKAAVAGVVTFNMTSLNRGGTYTLSAASGMLTPGVSNAIKVNASSIVFVSAGSAGSGIFNPNTGGNVMPPNSVRSSAQNAIVDVNKDVLGATVVGRDITGAGADIAANVTISIVSAKQFRDGVIVNIPAQSNVNPNGFKLDGNVTQNAPGSTLVYDANNAHMTINRWGDYMLQASANDGLGFMSNSMLAGIVTVIARNIVVVNAPLLVVGPFQVITQARDITGDVAQNYTGPSDPTVLTINEIAGRQNPGVVGTMGTASMNVGNSVVAKANPFRGVTTFNFNATRPVLVTMGVIDQFEYFIGSDANSVSIDTLEPGRRRPRPIPPVINLRIRPR